MIADQINEPNNNNSDNNDNKDEVIGITDVTVLDDYQLEVTFDNSEVKIFDVKPHMDTPLFQQLKDKDYFNTVKVVNFSIEWKDGQDICPDIVYSEGITKQ